MTQDAFTIISLELDFTNEFGRSRDGFLNMITCYGLCTALSVHVNVSMSSISVAPVKRSSLASLLHGSLSNDCIKLSYTIQASCRVCDVPKLRLRARLVARWHHGLFSCDVRRKGAHVQTIRSTSRYIRRAFDIIVRRQSCQLLDALTLHRERDLFRRTEQI